MHARSDGFAVFALASFAGGLAESGSTLIAARALQGLGAAILSPAALSLVTTMFAEGAERNTALGVWGAVAAGGGAAGSLLGGVITQTLGWEWVLWINTPIGIAAALLAPTVLRESRTTTPDRSFDALGAIAVTGGLVALVYGVIDGLEAIQLTLAAALLAAFVVIESRTSNPLVPFAIFLNRSLTGATVTGVLMGARADRPVLLRHALPAAGPALRPADRRPRLPAAGAGDRRLGRPRRPALDQARPEAGARRGPHGPGGRPVLVQPRLGGRSFLGDVLFPSLVAALGMGLAFVPLTIAAMSGVTENESGLASGLMATAQQIGQAVGLAILAGVATTPTATPEALTDGFEDAFLLAGGFALIAALAASTIIAGTRAPRPGAAVPVPA